MKSLTRILIISFIGLIISLGLVLFVVKPTLADVSSLNQQVSAKNSELQALQDQINIYRNSQSEFAQITGKDVIAGSLLKRDDLQVAIEEIESAATEAGITETLTIADDTTPGAAIPLQIVNNKIGLDEVDYELNLTSNFGQLIKFLQYLEYLPHFTEISKISTTAVIGTSTATSFTNSGQITTTLDGVFFVQKQ